MLLSLFVCELFNQSDVAPVVIALKGLLWPDHPSEDGSLGAFSWAWFWCMVWSMVIFCGRCFLRRLKISDVGIWQDWFKRLSASWQERVEIGASLQARVETDAGLKE